MAALLHRGIPIGGTDRFSINTVKQIFNCRSCKKGGDVIDLVMFIDGIDFNAAVEKLTGKPPAKLNGHADKPIETGRIADMRRHIHLRRFS
jgi:DNA primase